VRHDELTKSTKLQTKTAESNASPWYLCYGAWGIQYKHQACYRRTELFTCHM